MTLTFPPCVASSIPPCHPLGCEGTRLQRHLSDQPHFQAGQLGLRIAQLLSQQMTGLILAMWYSPRDHVRLFRSESASVQLWFGASNTALNCCDLCVCLALQGHSRNVIFKFFCFFEPTRTQTIEPAGSQHQQTEC